MDQITASVRTELWHCIMEIVPGHPQCLRSRSGGQRLTLLADHFRLLADSLEPVRAGDPAPAEFFRIHIRMEKAPKTGALSPTLSYW